MVRVSGLEKETCVKKYQERLRGDWQKVRVNEIRGVGEEWEVFMEAVLACARDICRTQKVGGWQIRNGTEWWEEEIKLPENEKREIFGWYLLGMSSNHKS